MKSTNVSHDNQQSLLKKVAVNVGSRLADIPIDPFQCWGFALYEPELSNEIIDEMRDM